LPNAALCGFKIFNSSLSAAQVAAMYCGVFAGNGSPLPSTTNVAIAAGATLDVNGVTQAIGSLSGPAGSNVTLGSGKLTIALSSNSQFDGNISGSGGSIAKSGGGSLTLTGNSAYTGVTTVQGGALVLKGAGAQSPVMTAGGADVKSGKLVMDYTGAADPLADVKAILAVSYATNFASGQIRSSNIQDARKGIGYFDDTASSQLLLMYTYYGDANLDGQVNSADFAALATSFNSTAAAATWQLGDSNFDGTVNALDFNVLASNFGQTPIAASGLGSLVPEPAMAGVVSCAAVLVLRRRWRQDRSGSIDAV
jgi:autotransporter-associated beta strand protein